VLCYKSDGVTTRFRTVGILATVKTLAIYVSIIYLPWL